MTFTVKDFSKEAGLSIKTLSRVINTEPNVPDSTKNKILVSIVKFRFKPNKSTQN